VNQNGGQVEKEKIDDRFVAINFVLQILSELQISHVFIHEYTQHGLNLKWTSMITGNLSQHSNTF
jgi:hypothetical protein